MKKNIIILLTFVFFIVNLNAAQKNMTKLIGGASLTCIGGLLTYWGFSFKSTSLPEITMQSFTWNKNLNSTWDINYNGTIKNSGNTDINNIKLSITFKNSNNVPVSTQVINGPSLLPAGGTYNFNNSYNTGSEEPGFVSVLYSGNFTETLETRDLFIGITGLATAVCGLFFIADYIFDFTSPLEEKNISIKLLPDYSGIKLLALKNF
jgi:hypothetical protein